MKPSFHVRMLNGPFEDPGLYIRITREGRAIMFDLGLNAGLSPGDILKVRDIFVSHTHIDHFIGFDNVLRVCLKKEDPLRLYGPKGFIKCVEGKLGSYTWNLAESYPLVIEVSEISEGLVNKAVFRAANAFSREDRGVQPFDGTVMKDSFYQVSGVILDHRIPSLAFSLEEEFHINIDKAGLGRLNLPVGPWLGELKQAIREGRHDKTFTITGKTYNFQEVKEIAIITRGQKISYVVDAVGSEDNIQRIINLVKGSDVLYIETYFSDKDRDRTLERYHLTAKEAARIAREAGVGRVEAIHFSPRYMNDPGLLIKELSEEFPG